MRLEELDIDNDDFWLFFEQSIYFYVIYLMNIKLWKCLK